MCPDTRSPPDIASWNVFTTPNGSRKSNRDCVGFPFLHKDMCATHAFSMQVQVDQGIADYGNRNCDNDLALSLTNSRVPYQDFTDFMDFLNIFMILYLFIIFDET